MPWILGGTEFGTSDPSADAATRQALIDALGIKVIDDQTLQITLPTASSVATDHLLDVDHVGRTAVGSR